MTNKYQLLVRLLNLFLPKNKYNTKGDEKDKLVENFRDSSSSHTCNRFDGYFYLVFTKAPPNKLAPSPCGVRYTYRHSFGYLLYFKNTVWCRVSKGKKRK